jgi:hypothetical protein
MSKNPVNSTAGMPVRADGQQSAQWLQLMRPDQVACLLRLSVFPVFTHSKARSEYNLLLRTQVADSIHNRYQTNNKTIEDYEKSF